MKVKQRLDPIFGEVDAEQFIDDGKMDTFKDRHVFRDSQGAYIEAGGLGDGFVRSGDFLVTLGNGRFTTMTAKDFYEKYDAEPSKAAAKADVAKEKADAAQLAKDEKAADKFGMAHK